MYKLTSVHIFCILFSFSVASKENSPNPRIVGGFPTDIVNVPYIVSVQLYGNHHCGGSIINNRTIVTAAHCLAGIPRRLLKVKVGGSSRDPTDGQLFSAASIHYHDKWSAKTMDYDIGLIRLVNELTYSRKVKAIGMNRRKIPDGSFATIAGWGFTTANGSGTQVLHFARVPIVNQTVCKTLLGNRVTERMICAGYLNDGGVDACQMDSGGPLVVRKELVGIVSWGIGCALTNKPGVYARIETLFPWLNNLLKKLNTAKELAIPQIY
ncbi:trypsin alpha-3 [Drosophila obscura]|uniref:trypsin alpha-3 n=1 Tax=Drosophila obscura TaxID=7282 RepID=UPI001BB21817|nr:trypsin alpha-3 [Drosophila obscura]